ncbi:dienelactone hydrolase family protein [Phenylobacterium sp.]|uniref:dienelactone hydrolase family protein n=1 Tax=Phenylobacterium sp. TaxID=1871053 RepID=UPI002734C07C|nr:dienelactone hydrolase family protein [Phenylobacterium sp.]MDP3852334.1 dienelactone hydrolase family protein [Phenylobacterium sp.]
MVVLTPTRPEGAEPEDFHLSRRGLAAAVLAGYALAARSAQAQPVVTDAAGLVTEMVQVETPDRAIPAFVARPAARGRFPVVVVIPEVFGLHEYIRDICRRLAKLGYVAISPDLFIRQGDPSTVTDFAAVRKIVGEVSEAQVMSDVASALTFVKAQKYADPAKIAITGFCWGGAIVWLASARFKDIKAGAAWYGRLSAPKPGEFLGEPNRTWPLQVVGRLGPPVIGLYAGKDGGIPVSDVEAMRAALTAAGRTSSQIVLYPDSQHGFHADYRASYDATAATDAWNRMLTHFAANGVKPKAYRAS